MNALTCIDDRPLRGAKCYSRCLDGLWIGPAAGRIDGGVVDFALKLLTENIGWHFNQHRPAATIAQLREGPAHDIWDILYIRDRFRRFGDVLEVQR